MSVKQAETSRSIFKNVIYGFSTWILPLILSFVSIKIIIEALGEKEYGIYMLVLGFVGYSFNFSLGRAITKYIAEYRISDQNEKIRGVISATFFLNVIIGLLNVLVICLLARWLVTDAFEIEPQYWEKTIIAFYIASAIIFFSMFTQIFNAVLQGLQRFDVYSKIFNLGTFILIIGNIVLALAGYGLNYLLLWNLFVALLNNLLFFISAKRLLPEFGVDLKFKKETAKLVANFSFGIVGYQILTNFLLLFERGWLTKNLGAESLTYYVVPMMLALYIHGFIGSLLLVIFPLASELKNDKVKLLKLYSKATKIVCLIAFFLTATLIVQSRYLLTVWLGAEFADKSWLILVMHAITFGFLAIQIVSWQMTEGLGYPAFNFKIISLTLIISVFLMIVLIKDYGSVGVAFGRTCGFLAIFSFVFYIEKWFFEKVLIVFWLKIFGILSISVLLSVCAEKLITYYFPFGWITLLSSIICGGIVYLLTAWILGYVAEDEKLLIKNILLKS